MRELRDEEFVFMSSNGTDGRGFWNLQGFTIMTFKKENIILNDWRSARKERRKEYPERLELGGKRDKNLEG